ncbi:hypothetical protein HK099_007150 [Clydaea vesicula]|uniref:Importin N-terminal domain-containing protein n=1 Tax=Clydaea vesicula TaxID=447962 RepID=A0AAD5U5K9_9FUNG|nr:hypothetical protein HK099_007150 [Clydaea vesicula]
MNFTPNQDGLQQLIQVLLCFKSLDNQVQRSAVDKLNAFNSEVPDYFCYLAYIFANMPDTDPYLRSLAGTQLKNSLQPNFALIAPQVIAYVKECVVKSIMDAEDSIKNISATLVTTIYTQDKWPEVIPHLINFFEHPDVKIRETCFSAINLICEDSTQSVGSSELVTPLVQKLIQNMANPSVKIRRLSLNSCNQFILVKSPGFSNLMPQFVQALYQRTQDPDPEVRKYVCQSFVMIAEVNIDILMPEIENLINFILHVCGDADEDVAREACEFWLVAAEHSIDRFELEPLLPRLLPVLLKGMVYSENDMTLLTGNSNDEDVIDRDQDFKPRHHRSQLHASGKPEQAPPKEEPRGDFDEDDDDDYDDDDEVEEWNLRKCSAAALDVISTITENEMLPHLLPLLTEQLNSTDWKNREAGILALGAIADGCNGMNAHLPGVLPVLVKTLKDPVPLVRSITCWTIGRYSRWTVTIPENVNKNEFLQQYFAPVLSGVNGNKKVQEAACRRSWNRTYTIYRTYTSNSFLCLSKIPSTLADAVKGSLNEKRYIDLIMPPLLQKYELLREDPQHIFSLMECLSSMAEALGPGFSPFVIPIWGYCLQLISHTLHMWQLHSQNPDDYQDVDKDYIIISLDLMSSICNGMGNQAEAFVSRNFPPSPPLIPLLFACLKDVSAEVRQSAYALLGDLALSAFNYVKPSMPQIMPLLIQQIDPNVESALSSACNNAAWAGGEIALHMKEEMTPYVGPLLERLVPLLKNEKVTLKALNENAAITIGRLGYILPDMVAPHLEHFIQPWCLNLGVIRDNLEKESAFLGMCKMIEKNPNGVGDKLVYFCDAVVRWNKPSQDLNNFFAKILHGFKQLAGEQWEQILSGYPNYIQQKLKERYGV